MVNLKVFFASPFVLLIFMLAGAVFGYLQLAMGDAALVIGRVYLAAVNMAALPLLVVATMFGLRQVSSLPNPGGRLLRLFGMAGCVVFISAFLGAGFGLMTGAGKGLTVQESRHLGGVVMAAGGDASNSEMNLFTEDFSVASEFRSEVLDLIPENFFHALAQGQILSILVGALIFGVAIAAQDAGRTATLMSIFEAIYRGMENIISRANLLIPILLFGMAANFVAVSNADTLWAMGGFVVTFSVCVFIICALLTCFIWKKAGQPLGAVISALKTPVLISLSSTSATASIPDTINAISSKLGFSRGLAEFIVPVSSVFMRSGAAFYFAILIVFVSNLYGHPVGLSEFLLICVGATLGAFTSAGNAGIATLASVGVALQMHKLPVEAVLPLFLAIDIVCEGPRSLLSNLTVCALVAVVSDGLPFEKTEQMGVLNKAEVEPLRLTFSKSSVAFLLICIIVVAILITIAGIGVGMR